MHNIDRTVGESNYEYNNESYEMNPESYEYSGEFGSYEMEGEDEFLNELNELTGEYSGETNGEYSGELSNEALEMELATELLEVTNEAELEQFLGGLFKKVAGAAKNFANSSTGKALGGILKSAAKKALPIIGGAAGTFLGGPAGAALGGKLGSMASNLFELELEGLSNEDKEFELARGYVRFATSSLRNALRSPQIRTNPGLAAKNAVISAAKQHAPGLLRKQSSTSNGRRGSFSRRRPSQSYSSYNIYNDAGYNDIDNSSEGSGTWYRQGNQIILNL